MNTLGGRASKDEQELDVLSFIGGLLYSELLGNRVNCFARTLSKMNQP